MYVIAVQLSSIVLKQYVETHWCHLSEKFHEPEPPEQVSYDSWVGGDLHVRQDQ